MRELRKGQPNITEGTTVLKAASSNKRTSIHHGPRYAQRLIRPPRGKIQTFNPIDLINSTPLLDVTAPSRREKSKESLPAVRLS
jgi:hypothetical protein